MWLWNEKKTLVEHSIFSDFTDVHSHLLYGVDDGARALEQTKEMIEGLKQLGVKRSFLTPHVMANLPQNTGEKLSLDFRTKLLPLVSELDFEMRLAAEYMMDEMFLAKLEKEERLLTYDGEHLLIEMSHIAPPINRDELLFEIENCNYTPVLAHPERYCGYFSMEDYNKYRARGYKFQLNVLSLGGVYGRDTEKMAKKLLDCDMYDFVGTDIHARRAMGYLKSIKLTDNKVAKIKQLAQNNNELWGMI